MGKLYFKYGPMNSGKSMFLLATAHNLRNRGLSVLLLKSAIDKRECKNTINSRALGEEECILIDNDTNIYDCIKELVLKNEVMFIQPLTWLLIDEAQFLDTKHIDELAAVADDFDINVICYGLRTDFKTNLFDGSKRLFEIADSLEEMKSTCSCGGKNIFNARIDVNGNVVIDGEQILLGKENLYLSMCRKCFNKKIINN